MRDDMMKGRHVRLEMESRGRYVSPKIAEREPAQRRKMKKTE